MGIFGLFKRRHQSDHRPMAMGQTISLDSITNSKELADWLRSGGAMTASGAAVTPETAMKVAAVFRCVDLISGAISSLPIDVNRDLGENRKEPAKDHYLWRLLRRRPNEWMTPVEFKRLLMTHLLLRGNGFARIVRGVGGRVISLIPMSPERMEVEQLDNLSLKYTYTRKDGTKIELNQRDVFHVRGLSFDGIVGVSPITYARESIGLSMQAERFGARLFKNGTSLAAVLKHPQHLSEEAIARLKEGLEHFRGADNAFKTMILEEGMDLTPIGMTSEDAQYIALREFQRGEIYQIFGVPPHMAGDTQKTTSWGSGIEQMTIGFVTHTLTSWMTSWEQAIVRDLLSDRDNDIYVRFNTRALLKGDVKTRFGAYREALQWGWLSPDEVRALEDMNPRDDGNGGVYYEPPNAPGGNAKKGDGK